MIIVVTREADNDFTELFKLFSVDQTTIVGERSDHIRGSTQPLDNPTRYCVRL